MYYRILQHFLEIVNWKTKWKREIVGKVWAGFRPKASRAQPSPVANDRLMPVGAAHMLRFGHHAQWTCGGVATGGERHVEVGCGGGEIIDKVVGTHQARIGRWKLTEVMGRHGGGDFGRRGGGSTAARRFGGWQWQLRGPTAHG
jgi:hypothetical protein